MSTLPDERPDPEEPAEDRWTPDEVSFRDMSHHPLLRARAAEELARFVPDVQALGFVDLGLTGTTFDEELECVPDLTDEDLAGFEEAAANGEPGAAERLEWARSMRSLDKMWAGVNLAWNFVHPTTGDTACLERTDHGEWLSFVRLHEDGTILRTIRRPEHIPPGAPEATGTFIDARFPGLYRLICWLGGDQFQQSHPDLPLIRQRDQVTASLPAEEVWAAHLAFAASHDPGVPAITPSMSLELACSRRTMHVTFAALERANGISGQVWLAGSILGSLAVGGITWAASTWWAALAAIVLVPRFTNALWAVATGCASWLAPVVPTLLLGALGWAAEIPPVALLAAVVASQVGVVGSRLGFFWCGQAGRRFIDRGLTEPPAVPAAELERRYPA